jgi:CRISPR-associated protein (TIGR02710 family)
MPSIVYLLSIGGVANSSMNVPPQSNPIKGEDVIETLAENIIEKVGNVGEVYLGMLCSQMSKQRCEQLVNILKNKSSAWQSQDPIIKVIDNENIDNLQNCYKIASDLNKAMRTQLGQKLNESEDDSVKLYCNPTSGTKSMSIGLSVAFVLEKSKWPASSHCEIVIVNDKKDELSNSRRSSTSVSVKAIEVDISFKIAESLLSINAFDAAINVVKNLKAADYQNTQKNDLMKIAQFWSSWDKFDHKNALNKRFDDANLAGKRLENIMSQEISGLIPKPSHKAFLESLLDNQSEANVWKLRDLVYNAKRLAMNEKYDDAVGRLYRCIELIGQIALRSFYGINDSDVKEDDNSNEKFKEYVRNKRISLSTDEKIKIGLMEKLKLLELLGHALGSNYNDKLKRLLRDRNSSILAHGFTPIEKSTYDKIFEFVKNMSKTINVDFDEFNEPFPYKPSIINHYES